MHYPKPEVKTMINMKKVVDAVEGAMIEYGPDGHCDGAEEISEAAVDACSVNDLYYALKEMTEVQESDLVGFEFKEAMQAAIRKGKTALAKARGEQ
jgi:hypothetical protein